jgi:hypothetical protein
MDSVQNCRLMLTRFCYESEAALFVLPRVVKRSGGGGPREAWWRGRAASTILARLQSPSTRVAIQLTSQFGNADAPSTALRAVPLPRFAGADGAS